MERPCDVCGTTYTAKRPNSRYCSDTCRKRAQRGASVSPKTAEALAQDATPPGGLAAITEKELRDAGRLETVPGQSAMVLARRLDAQTTDTGNAVAALVRELQATMETALKGASSTVDPIDELRRKRDQRRAAAG